MDEHYNGRAQNCKNYWDYLLIFDKGSDNRFQSNRALMSLILMCLVSAWNIFNEERKRVRESKRKVTVLLGLMLKTKLQYVFIYN